jgi:inhibitor of KinA sporulation pathway (predicted exonuclease)
MDSGDSPTLGDTLLNFSRWVKNHRKPRVWSNGATFDIAILENAYRQLGYEEHIPWLYPHIRDVRTVCALAEGVVNKELFLFQGTPHVAVDDAIHQAKYVCAMWQALRG